jgi:hypothetical protein
MPSGGNGRGTVTFRRRFTLRPCPSSPPRGIPPLGWRRDPATGRLEVDPGEARAVRIIMGQAAEGKTARETVASLEASGIPPRGARWHERTVRRLRWRHRTAAMFWGSYLLRPPR